MSLLKKELNMKKSKKSLDNSLKSNLTLETLNLVNLISLTIFLGWTKSTLILRINRQVKDLKGNLLIDTKN